MARLWFFALIATLAAGCGSAEPRADGDAEFSEREVTVAALGDSITAGSPLYDPDPALREAFGLGSHPESQYEYWARQAAPQLEFVNCGKAGERTDEIALRLPECAEGADLVIIQGGINDIAQASGAGPPAVAEAVRSAEEHIDGMLAEAADLGLEVAVANVLPWNNGHPAADRPIARLNDAVARAAKRRGVPLLDFHNALESTEEPGTMAPEYTDDGNHPSVEGYRVLGELVARRLG